MFKEVMIDLWLVNIIFSQSLLILTFTESKDSNCFILYFE